MGLDVVCACHKIDFRAGSYGGFHEYRMWIAGKMKLKIENDVGIPYPEIFKGMPFEDFIDHSDCDGKLTYTKCKRLLPQFREFLDKLKREERQKVLQSKNPWKGILEEVIEPDSADAYGIEQTEVWIKAFQHCIDHTCELIFC